MPLDTGEIVGDRYRVVKLLGQGGMGAVYRAWDTRLNRPVALKEMTPQSSLNLDMLAQLRQQFKQEAQVLATLVHPNLVRVTDYFSWGGNEYLVMDFVAGESLAERMEREGAQSETQVLAWTGQLLDALAYCHEKGVIHRDIKPHNIIITPEGQAVLVDFGLVKLWDPQDPRTRTVMRGAGTPEYAPPEQYDMGLGHTDPRSDIYGLGATIYHALTGQAPPTATQRMASPTSFSPPRRVNAAINSVTEEIVLKALTIAMDDRYQSAKEMAQALGVEPRISAAAPDVVQAFEPAQQIEPPTKKKRGILLGLGGVGLAGVGLLCLALAVGAVLLGLSMMDGGGATTPATVTPWPTATLTPQLPTTPEPPAATPRPATATPRPVSTPAPETGGVLLRDDFGDPNSGWEVGDYEGGSVGYEDGIYFVRSEQDGSVMWGVFDRSLDDLVIEVDATQILAPANDNNAYGVKCREQSDGDGYGFMVSGDGYYSIQIVVDGDWEQLVDWSASDVIQQGNGTNRIRAVCDGAHLALFVNGELLAETEDSTYSEGIISLAASTLEDEPTEIHFDDLVVRRPMAVLFRDDFGDADSGWEVGDYDTGSVGYEDGTYFVTSIEMEQMMWGRAFRDFSDTIIEVDATQISGPDNDNNAYGVMCRVQSNDDGYVLRISGDGYYAIHVIVDGEFGALVDWSPSDVIRQGDTTNHIRAICDGASIALFVNGELLAEAEDGTFAGGDIALTATTFEDDPTEVRFDDLVVYAP